VCAPEAASLQPAIYKKRRAILRQYLAAADATLPAAGRLADHLVILGNKPTFLLHWTDCSQPVLIQPAAVYLLKLTAHWTLAIMRHIQI